MLLPLSISQIDIARKTISIREKLQWRSELRINVIFKHMASDSSKNLGSPEKEIVTIKFNRKIVRKDNRCKGIGRH